MYISLVALPSALATTHLSPLQPHATYILSTLIKSQAFYIVPGSDFHALNPRELPREIFVRDDDEPSAPTWGSSTSNLMDQPKKKGRPTKREKMKRAKDALGNLDKWLEKNTYIHQTVPADAAVHPGVAAGGSQGVTPSTVAPIATHILLSHPPTTSRNNYRTQKSELLDSLAPAYSHMSGTSTSTFMEKTTGQKALENANHAVLARLQKIDEMAAEKGLEVGGEGGERTGLERVERAVADLDRAGAMDRRGGILGLLEGGGMEVVTDVGMSFLPQRDISPGSR